jgi:hypothetical protein
MVICLSLKLILMVGVLVFVVSTVGFGNDLTAATFNNIGAKNNVSVPIPDADITNVVLTESASNIVSATITVKNTDSSSHSYNVCVITKAGELISDIQGTNSDCTNTATISASDTGSAIINFANPLSSSTVDYSDISVQQIT